MVQNSHKNKYAGAAQSRPHVAPPLPTGQLGDLAPRQFRDFLVSCFVAQPCHPYRIESY